MPEKKRLTRTEKAIGTFGLATSLCFFFFTTYIATDVLLTLIHANTSASHTCMWLYTWISCVVTYFYFALPKAMNNGSDFCKMLTLNNDTPKAAVIKALMASSLGTFSFSALACFTLEEALQKMPLVKKFSPPIKDGIVATLTVSTAIMFFLSKSLETYQHFAASRHFKKHTPSIKEYPNGARHLLRTHQFIGHTYLIMILGAYFRVNLNLLENFGANISPKTTHSHYLLVAAILAISACFIERVFSYNNMIITSKNLFATPVHDTLLKETETHHSYN